VEDEPIKQWQPGKVKINKITKSFPYLVTTGLTSPPTSKQHAQLIVQELPDRPRPISKLSLRWARRLAQRKALQHNCNAEMHAINKAIKEAMLDLGATSNFIQSADGLELTGPSSKTISTASGHVMRATMTALLPLRQLKAGAREAIIVPELSTKKLMSVK
jgi:hypothetical protein